MRGGLVKQSRLASWSEAEYAGLRRTAGIENSVRLLELSQKCHVSVVDAWYPFLHKCLFSTIYCTSSAGLEPRSRFRESACVMSYTKEPRRAAANKIRADPQEYALAGRFLRRLPVLAHARYIAPSLPPGEIGRRSLKKWLDAMTKVVEDERRSKGEIEQADGHKVPAAGRGTEVKVAVDGH